MDVRVMQRFDYHGADAASLVEVHATDDTAWLTLNSFVTPGHQPDAPTINLYFDRGLRGRQQILALVAQLEAAASVVLEHADAEPVSQ
jgi:hypothetical protein